MALGFFLAGDEPKTTTEKRANFLSSNKRQNVKGKEQGEKNQIPRQLSSKSIGDSEKYML